MGVRFPLPAPSIPFICNDLRAGKRLGPEFMRYKYGTVRILFILNNLHSLMRLRPSASLHQVEIRLRSITGCVADNRSAGELLPKMQGLNRTSRFGTGRELRALGED